MFKILVLTSTDLIKPEGRSTKSLQAIARVMDQFPPGIIELVVLHALEDSRNVSWEHLPPEIRQYAEMRFHSAWPGEAPTGKAQARHHMYTAEDAYSIYGVSRDQGAACVVRPDGYVAMTASLDSVRAIEKYLQQWLQLQRAL